jgi:transketolase
MREKKLEVRKNKMLKRFEMDNVIRLKKGKEIIDINYKKFLKANNIDGIIRIQKSDYKFLKDLKDLTHFNINGCGHKKGNKYALMKIEETGCYKKNGDEKLPILNSNEFYLANCVGVKEKIKYEKIVSDVFKNSFPNIKNIDSLKKEILKRYKKSLPDYSNEELLSFGVSVTNLKILNKQKVEIKGCEMTSYFDKIKKKEMGSIRHGFGEALAKIGKKDEDIVLVCADLTSSLKGDIFAKKFPKRYYQVGVAEQNMMGLAAGMARVGKVPFVLSYAVFNPGRNWDQLRVSVCYQNSNVKIIGGHVGLLTGPDGGSHQALEDIALTRVLPNLIVLSPCDEEEMKKAVKASVKHEGPVYIRMPRAKTLKITDSKTKFEIGKGIVLDEGNDLTIIATGDTVQIALEAKKKLEENEISAAVINIHTIKPIDKKLIIKYAKKTGAIITIEDHQIHGGLGSAVSEVLVQEYPVPQEMIGVENTFGESGDGYKLLKKYNITTKEIVLRSKRLMKRKLF